MAVSLDIGQKDSQASRRRHVTQCSTTDLLDSQVDQSCQDFVEHPHHKHHAPAYRSIYQDKPEAVPTNRVGVVIDCPSSSDHLPRKHKNCTSCTPPSYHKNMNSENRGHTPNGDSCNSQLYDLARPNTSTTTTASSPSSPTSPFHQTGPRHHRSQQQHPPPKGGHVTGQAGKPDELMKLNVGGVRFSTYRSTLEKKPCTLLYGLRNTDDNYDHVAHEWFFDRNPAIFSSVLDYLRDEHHELHFPHNFCGPSIKKELLHWKVDDSCIAPCCWNRYREFEEDKKIFQHIEQAFGSSMADEESEDSDSDNITLGHARLSFHHPHHQVVEHQQSLTSADQQKRKLIWRKKIYTFLEEPMSSRPAKIWAFVFLCIVLASIGCLCMETLPNMRVYRTISLGEKNDTIPEEYRNNPKLKDILNTEPHPLLEHLDTFCTWFFTVEFIVRLAVVPDRVRFWKSMMNIIDVLCVLPMWIKYIMLMNNIRYIRMDFLGVYFGFMMLRVLRICRVLRMARHYTAVKILLLALKASMRELMMLMIFVFIVVLIFSVVIYYAEFFVDDTFRSIPHGYWWAIITLTTVGYGDMFPKSVYGYVVGAMCALVGILATGLPVPIIANNFNLYYGHAQLKQALDDNKKLNNERKRKQDLAALMLGIAAPGVTCVGGGGRGLSVGVANSTSGGFTGLGATAIDTTTTPTSGHQSMAGRGEDELDEMLSEAYNEESSSTIMKEAVV